MAKIEDFQERRVKLFIPGPVEVDDDVLQAMSHWMIGHRTKAMSALSRSVSEKLQKLLYTKNKTFVFTCSGTGVMEGSIRSLTKRKALVSVLGAFSSRWYKIAQANGIPVDKVEVKMGEAITPEMVDKYLTKDYDVFTLTHNETSTGVMEPIYEIAEVVKEKKKENPDLMFLVDAVSSMAGVKLEVDKLGVDVIFASVQKAFGLPPGVTVVAVSERALEKARTVPNRGWYLDIATMDEYYQKKNFQTPSTPSIPHFYALDYQLSRFFEEGLENRFRRHIEMAEFVRKWAKENWELFPEEKYSSITLTCIKNTKNISVKKLNELLFERGMWISNGYGDLKEKTFRIAHMADLTLDDLKDLIDNIEDILKNHPEVFEKN